MFAIRRRLRGPRPRLLRSWVVLLFGLSFACASQRGVPLYPGSGQQRALEEVALLNGDVQLIDGKNVSDLGKWFELLPGCHVVTTPPEARARVESSASGVVPTNGQFTYAMNMKPGHRYVIERRMWQLQKSRFVVITAFEKDPEGTVTRQLVPAAREEDLAGCQPPADAAPPAPVGPSGSIPRNERP